MKKSVVLIIVIGLMFVMTTLAFVALFFMTTESRISEKKVKRMRAFSAAEAGIAHAFERLANGDSPSDVNGETIVLGDHSWKGYPARVRISVDEAVSGTGTAYDGTYPVHATVRY